MASNYMNIGEAVNALKEGKRITRGTWYGNNQYVVKSTSPTEFLIHHKHDGTVTPWAPNQDDIMAENFLIYTGEN